MCKVFWQKLHQNSNRSDQHPSAAAPPTCIPPQQIDLGRQISSYHKARRVFFLQKLSSSHPNTSQHIHRSQSTISGVSIRFLRPVGVAKTSSIRFRGVQFQIRTRNLCNLSLQCTNRHLKACLGPRDSSSYRLLWSWMSRVHRLTLWKFALRNSSSSPVVLSR